LDVAEYVAIAKALAQLAQLRGSFHNFA